LALKKNMFFSSKKFVCLVEKFVSLQDKEIRCKQTLIYVFVYSIFHVKK